MDAIFTCLWLWARLLGMYTWSQCTQRGVHVGVMLLKTEKWTLCWMVTYHHCNTGFAKCPIDDSTCVGCTFETSEHGEEEPLCKLYLETTLLLSWQRTRHRLCFRGNGDSVPGFLILIYIRKPPPIECRALCTWFWQGCAVRVKVHQYHCPIAHYFCVQFVHHPFPRFTERTLTGRVSDCVVLDDWRQTASITE